jgi:hypothetical protein
LALYPHDQELISFVVGRDVAMSFSETKDLEVLKPFFPGSAMRVPYKAHGFKLYLAVIRQGGMSSQVLELVLISLGVRMVVKKWYKVRINSVTPYY